MEIDAFLADSVASADGKLYAQGAGWTVLSTTSVPARHPRVGIGIIIRVPYTATDETHVVSLRLEDADGNELTLGDAPPGLETSDGKLRHLGGQFHLGRPPGVGPGDEQLVALAINVDGLVFDNVGRYRFVISVDGRDVKHLPLRVHPEDAPSGGAG